jgi:hypothetical protein
MRGYGSRLSSSLTTENPTARIIRRGDDLKTMLECQFQRAIGAPAPSTRQIPSFPDTFAFHSGSILTPRSSRFVASPSRLRGNTALSQSSPNIAPDAKEKDPEPVFTTPKHIANEASPTIYFPGDASRTELSEQETIEEPSNNVDREDEFLDIGSDLAELDNIAAPELIFEVDENIPETDSFSFGANEEASITDFIEIIVLPGLMPKSLEELHFVVAFEIADLILEEAMQRIMGIIQKL